MADANDDDRRSRDEGSAWESGIERPLREGEESTDPPDDGSPDGRDPQGSASGQRESTAGTAMGYPSNTSGVGDDDGDAGHVGIDGDVGPVVPDPGTLPPETDPTGAGWWRALTVATGLAVAGFFLWPLLGPFMSVSEVTAGTRFDTTGALLALAPLLLLVLVRFVVLPVALWRDATLLRESSVDWNPSRGFYVTAGALWASLTCAYYLYKRSRHTGRPSLPIPAERLHFTGRRVESNWHLVVGVAMLVGPLAAGFDVLFVTVESVPGGDVLGAMLAMVFVVLLAVAFVLLPVAFYRDCRAVRRSDADWQPTTWFYVIAGYLLTLPVGAYYLYKRTRIESL